MTQLRLTNEHLFILDTIPDPVVIYDMEGGIGYVNHAFEQAFGWTLGEVFGRHMDFVPEGQRSQLTDVVAIWLRDNVYLTPDTQRITRDGRIVDVQINSSLLMGSDGKPMGSVLILRDITERKRMEAAEHEQRTLAEALNEVLLALNSTLNLDEVLDLILVNLCRVVPQDLAIITRLDGDTVEIVGYRNQIYPEMNLIGTTFALHDLVTLNTVYRTGQPLLIPDLKTNPRYPLLPRIGWLSSYLAVPAILNDSIIGFISVQSAVPDFFTPVHAARLQTFANQAALAVRNATLYERDKELTAIHERHRIARDLHDAVSQTLYSANVMAETLLMQVEQGRTDTMAAGLARLQTLTEGALAEMRTLLLELRPEALLHADLAELLRQLTHSISGRKKLDVQLDIERGVLLEPDVQVAFYRIAQEALHNVLKHSRATALHVGLAESADGVVTLTFADDGIGFDLAAVPAGHFGLTNMRERAAAICADLEIESVPNSGTRVVLRWCRG